MSADAPAAFSGRTVAAVVAAGIASFAAFLLLFAYADDFRTVRDGRPHALSVSALGFRGLVRLIELQGGKARLIRSKDELAGESLVVAIPGIDEDGSRLETFLQTRGPRATLVVLPKWSAAEMADHPGWVRSLGPLPEPIVASALKPLLPDLRVRRHHGGGTATGRDMLQGFHAPLPAMLQTAQAKQLEPLLVAPDGGTLLGRTRGGTYLLADPDLLDNQALKDPARAQAALGLLEALNATGADEVAFDLTLNGFARGRGLMKLAFEPPLLPLTLALFVAALLAGLHGAFRFGPADRPRRAIALGKAALVENSAGLLRMARRETAVAGAYAELIAEAASHAIGAPPGLNAGALETYLDRLPAPGKPYSELAAQARAVTDRDSLVAAARALFSWKKELIK